LRQTIGRDSFDCHLGMLRLKRHGETGSISSATYFIQKATDGSLVASVSRTTLGFLVLFPYVESSRTWFRWLPAKT
jgi:hypothetical protein